MADEKPSAAVQKGLRARGTAALSPRLFWTVALDIQQPVRRRGQHTGRPQD